MRQCDNMMRSFLFVGVFLTTFLSAWTAPSINTNTASQMKDQMKNLQFHMSSLSDQFESILKNINNQKSGLKLFNGNDKRGVGTSSEAMEKEKEKEMRDELKEISKQLRTVHRQLHNLREKINNMKESLGEDDDDDDDDFDFDRREIKSAEDDTADRPECIKETIVEEKDPFILKVALTIIRQINAKENREYIESLVTRTADHLIAKMNATHGTKSFRRRLLKTVLELLKLRSILTIKTEGEFIDQLDERTTRTLVKSGKEVDKSKIFQVLEELLKGPLAHGFVSKGQEETMINEAVKRLGDIFKFPRNTTKILTDKMVADIQDEVKKNKDVTKYSKGEEKELDDDEKIKGLQEVVSEKAKKKNLNAEEVKILVKGLVAAIAARNKLSEHKTNQIENKIIKGVENIVEKTKATEKSNNEAEAADVKHFIDEHKDIPSGFKEAYISKYGAKYDKSSKDGAGTDGKEKRNILEKLKELEQLTATLGGKSLIHSIPKTREDLGDKGDQVIIDAATNTRGSTRIVEHHNGKKDEVGDSSTGTITEDADPLKNIQKFVNDLEGMIARFKSQIPSYRSPMSTYTNTNKTHEKVVIHAAKGTLGERKLIEGYKRENRLAEIVSNAIGLIKSLKQKQDHSTLHTTQSTTAEPTISATTEVRPTEMTTTESAAPEEVEEKSKKSEVSEAMKSEINKAEAQIQKELEKLQRKDEVKMLLAEEKRKEKEEQRKEQEKEEREQRIEKEREGKQAKEEKEREAKQKLEEKEQDRKEKERQKEESEKESAKKEEDSDGKESDSEDKISKAQLNVDEKEIEKALGKQAMKKTSLFDKLKSVQKAQKQSKPKKKDDDLIKELDQLFSKS